MPDERGWSVCKDCGESIIWVTTQKGKRMPIDVTPHHMGRFRKVGISESGKKLVSFVRDADIESVRRERVPLYNSHFETCEERI